MTLSDLHAVSFSPDSPISKSPVIFAHTDEGLEPLCYLKKPKHVSDELWEQFITGFEFMIRYKESDDTP